MHACRPSKQKNSETCLQTCWRWGLQENWTLDSCEVLWIVVLGPSESSWRARTGVTMCAVLRKGGTVELDRRPQEKLLIPKVPGDSFTLWDKSTRLGEWVCLLNSAGSFSLCWMIQFKIPSYVVIPFSFLKPFPEVGKHPYNTMCWWWGEVRPAWFLALGGLFRGSRFTPSEQKYLASGLCPAARI